MRQLVILAGGKGTRLKERLGGLPKPLIDVCGLPLLERQILLAKNYGFIKILLLVNYEAAKIIEFCKAKNFWGIEVRCVDDGNPRGTAGAVLNAYDLLEEDFLVMYGDTMLEVDLDRFLKFHYLDLGAAATLFLHPNDHPQDSDLVELDDESRIINFYNYPHPKDRYYPNLVNAALYLIRKKYLNIMKSAEHPCDFAKDLFPAMIKAGIVIRGYNSPEYIKDCGTPDRVDRVCKDFRDGRIQRASLQNRQKAVFLDRDGTVNVEVQHLKNVEQFELLPGAADAIKQLNLSDYKVCIATNQPVLARGDCTAEELKKIHNKMETLLGEKSAYIDRIYYCPHHPESGYAGEISSLKISCNCRKPEIGMILKAAKELNIDLSESWFVGDSTSDILTARRAGLKSILIEDGYAGLDKRHLVLPDFIVPNLQSAVTFMLNDLPKIQSEISKISVDIKSGDIVLVGGQSRSGKSNFSNALKMLLANKGINSHIISTDRWLLNENDRGEGLLNRHDMNALNYFFDNVLKRASNIALIKLPMYRKSDRRQFKDADTLELTNGDVLIFEGVVALSLVNRIEKSHSYFVEIDENERRRRLLREYSLRGFSMVESECIYEERIKEEAPFINEMAKYAVKFILPISTVGGWIDN